MKNITINEKIRHQFPYLSKKQKLIANYLIDNNEKISYKTLNEISNQVGVTEVTVINFCKAMGFKSFVKLKDEYRKETLEKISPTKKIFQNITYDSKYDDLSIKIIDQQIKNYKETLYRIKESDFEETVNLICRSRKVYIFCLGISTIIGNYLKVKLDTISIDVEIVDLTKINTHFFMKALSFTEEDLYICITFPRYSTIVLKFNKFFKNKGYNLINFTDKESSPLAGTDQITYLCENASTFFYNSISSAMSVIDVITSLTYVKLKEKLLSIQKEVEELEKEFSDFLT